MSLKNKNFVGKRGVVEADFLIASLLLVVMASLYLQHATSSVEAASELKKISLLEGNALKASELLKRKCSWSAAQQCQETLLKLNATLFFGKGGGMESGAETSGNRVCVRRLFGKNGFQYAEVCAGE